MFSECYVNLIINNIGKSEVRIDILYKDRRDNKMDFLSRLYECTMCGMVLTCTEDAEKDITCPVCGLTPCIPITDIREELKFKAKPHGKTGRPELEITIKDELHKDTNELRQIKMIVDRGHNDWEKTVIDTVSGDERYHKKEPLSDHINRGSAKKLIGEL